MCARVATRLVFGERASRASRAGEGGDEKARGREGYETDCRRVRVFINPWDIRQGQHFVSRAPVVWVDVPNRALPWAYGRGLSPTLATRLEFGQILNLQEQQVLTDCCPPTLQPAPFVTLWLHPPPPT